MAEAKDVLKRTRTRAGGTRQIADAGMIGVCIVIIATCLGLRELDASLHSAITLFAVAIPLLANSYLTSSWRVKGKRAKFIVECLQLSAAVLGTVGEAIVVVGLVDVLLYYGTFAAWAFVGSAILVFPATVLLALLIGIIYALWEWRKQKQGQQSAGPARSFPPADADADPIR